MKAQNTKWKLFLQEFYKLTYFWLFCIIIYAIFRIFLIIYFNTKLSTDVTTDDFINTILVGFKYDTHLIMLFLLIPFIANSIIFTKNREYIVSKIRLFFSYLFLTISFLSFVITPTYITEYNDQFNYFVFEALYDDTSAILHTIMLQYNPVISIIIFIILLTISIKLLKKINTIHINLNILNTKNIFFKFFIIIIMLFLVVIASRGTINGKATIRKWAYVTQDEFLNKIIMNPLRTLSYAYKDFKKLQNIKSKNPYLSNIKNISKDSYEKYTKKIAKGALINQPEHIILIVMESYDSWPLQEKYKDLHITDNLREIAKKGVHFKNFLPASHSTMNSLGSIVSGLPYSGVNISVLKSKNGPENTSIFEQMEKLGYDSYFFYGGFLSWQNIGNFMKNQGANNIISSVHIGKKTTNGVWGVDDNQLFDFVDKKLSNKTKTFSVILTTSYHGPFDIDVNTLGYPYKTAKDYPKKYQELNDGSISPLTLGHLWFSDKAIGNFVKKFESTQPNTLFAFTGDHYGRRYFNNKPNLYELSSVPFILYGSGITNNTINSKNIGNHMDIFPTIVELVAPKEFKYNSFGESMSFKKENEITFGFKKALDNNATYKINLAKGIDIYKDTKYSFANLEYLKSNQSLQNLTKTYKEKMGLYWHITIKGIDSDIE